MKVFTVKVENIIAFILAIFIVCGVMLTYYRENSMIHTSLPVDKKVVIIDAGHGGWDPGKKGTGGKDEKEINLLIAEKLQQYLEQGGCTVIITRNEDTALGTKKREDMNTRKEIINGSEGDMLISIHQNSFPQMSAKGAQVFYHNDSEKGRILAETIQNKFKEYVDSSNARQAKANTDYYILKNTKMVSAIVECGFLSNSSEEKMLNTDEYQSKVAWAIYMGIIEYFQNENISKV